MDPVISPTPTASHLSRSVKTVFISLILMAMFGLLEFFKVYFFFFEGQVFTAAILFGIPAVLLFNWKYGYKIWALQLLVFLISLPVIWFLFLVILVAGGLSVIP